MARPRKGTRVDTRGRILTAATEEFATRGYSAAGVDRIARRARVNKALIYYYFDSKQGLYRELLEGALAELITPLRALVDGTGGAEDKLARYIETLVGQLDRMPHLPRIMLRELADGGRHLDVEVLRRFAAMPAMAAALVAQGRAEGVFADFDPLMLHFVLMGTSMMMTTNMPIRRRVRELGLAEPPMDQRATSEVLQTVVQRTLRRNHADARDAR